MLGERQPRDPVVFLSGILVLLLSFPSVVVGNLFLPWLFPYETTDPRTLVGHQTFGDDEKEGSNNL